MECGEPILTIEQTAGLLIIKQRRIVRIIETEAAHFTEAEADAAMICIKALKEILGGGETLVPTNCSR